MHAGAVAAVLLVVLASSARAQQCGQLASAVLRNELAAAVPLELVARLSCDVRDETPGPWSPVDRSDPMHGCTMADVVVLQRAEQAEPAPIAQICAAEAAGDCCTTHESVGCSELAVSVCVCELEPRCCNGAWDATCAELACAGACAGVCVASDEPQPNTGLVEVPASPECPDGMVLVGAAGPFCVDRFEAALVQVPGDVPWSPYLDPGAATMRAVSLAGAVPQSNVDADQAEAACQNSGKRLCSNTEWLRACRGPSQLLWPYGASQVPGACNDTRAVHPLLEYVGLTETFVFEYVDHPCINQVQPGLAPTQAFAACVSAEGAFDLAGNLKEWTSDPAGTFRGGSYVESTLNGQGCLYATTAHDRGHREYSVGFRCCADPP